MTSILTNTSSMVALQTLKGINSNLESIQSQISTGKSVASAKDNSAVWAISKVMESDVAGFEAISDSLALGESTVAVAAQAAETVTDLLTQMKEKVVAAQGDNVDRTKLNDDVQALADQIKSVVGAAQFNGLNLVDGSQTTTNSNGAAGVDVLSSLDRDSSGNVTASNIGVNAQNLSTTAGTTLTAAALSNSTDLTASDGTAGSGADYTEITLGSAFLTAAGGADGAVALSKDTAGVNLTTATGLIEGDSMSMTIGSVTGNYVVKEGDTADAVLAGLKNSLISEGLDTSEIELDITTTGELQIENLTSNADIAVELTQSRGSGGLSELESLTVATESGATAALGAIEDMIATATDAAAAFGSVQSRIETQTEFVSNLTDSMTAGIGSLIDADMEEASARLQALQVQQQLGIQSLSIANSSPSSVMSLFQ